MEIKFEDRGKFIRDKVNEIFFREDIFGWDCLKAKTKEKWNRVFDACRKAELITTPGGEQVFFVDESNV